MDHAQSKDAGRHAGEPSEVSDASRGLESLVEGRPLDDVLLRALIESIAVPVYFIGRDGRIIYANAKTKDIPDPSQTGIQGTPLTSFETITIHPDGSPCHVDEYPAMECLRTAQPQPPKTIGIRDGHGGVTWVTASAIPFCHPVTGEMQGVIATVMDVSRSREVEQSLKQSEDSYRRLVENAPDAIVVHQHGRIVFINDIGVKLWGGKSPQDFIGRRVIDFVHPRYHEVVEQRMRQVMRGETTPLLMHRNLRLDGSIVPVEATAMPCVYEGQASVQVILRDVTERTMAERQIRRQREILRTFFQRLPVLVGIFDAQGHFKLVNSRWKQVIGWGKERSINELREYCLSDPADRRAAIELFERPKPGWRDFSVRVRDGSVHEISWATVQLSSGARVVIGQDVTRRKEAERALRQNQAELEQRVDARTEELVHKNEELRIEIAERRKTERELQEKRRFLERMLNTHERDRQLVAYEIHDTFLQGVIGALMYVDAYYESRLPEQAEQMKQLEAARNQLRKSIEEARRMISGLRPPIIDEQGVVAAIEYLISELKGRGVAIGFTHDIRRPRIAPLSEAAVFRIVQEGLTNALRHSQSNRVMIELTEGESELRLSVRDYGVGFNPEQVGDRHFGLQGIKERARLLGGTASIESSPGQGTTVRVTIPLFVEARAS